MPIRLAVAILSGLSLLLLGACSPTRSAAPEYYLLTATAAEPVAAIATTIGVGPVRVAPFLEGNGIAVHSGSGQLETSRRHRWAEPLDQGIQRVLVQNLATMTDAKLRNFPWRRRAQPSYAVRLDVLDMDRLVDGRTILDVIWHLEDMSQDKLVRSRRERFSTTPHGDDHTALAAAYSDLLAELAVRLVTALQAELDKP